MICLKDLEKAVNSAVVPVHPPSILTGGEFGPSRFMINLPVSLVSMSFAMPKDKTLNRVAILAGG